MVAFIKNRINKFSSYIPIIRYLKWSKSLKNLPNDVFLKVKKTYGNNTVNINFKSVVNIYDNNFYGGGLADRFKGIIASYHFAKQNNINYKLYFVSPFDLIDYLEPNLYNWQCSFNDIYEFNDNRNNIYLMSYDSTEYLKSKHKMYFNQIIRNNSSNQLHFYTNSNCAYNLSYSKLFNELFKPSIRLSQSLKRFLMKLVINILAFRLDF